VLDFSDHQAICSSVSHMTIFKICSELWHHLLKSRKEKCYYWLIQCHDIITFVIYTSSGSNLFFFLTQPPMLGPLVISTLGRQVKRANETVKNSVFHQLTDDWVISVSEMNSNYLTADIVQ
jgi:hypothetical protein